MKSRPEVVITGLGAVTPAGLNVEQTWACLLRAEQRVSTLEINVGSQHYRYPAGRVSDFPAMDGSARMDRCVQFGLHCTAEALAQAGLSEADEYLRSAGCVFSLSKPTPSLFAEFYEQYDRHGSLTGSDVVGTTWPNSCCVAIANRYRLMGPRLCLPTACATGAQSIIRGVGLILDGQAECVLAGAAEAPLTALYLAAFERMGVLAKTAGHPETACRPFDRHRTGFAIGEGAAAVVLESAEAARRRGANPLARIRSYWQGMHSLDLLQLEPDGASLAAGITQALLRAQLPPEQLDYISAHGTGTLANDPSETAAIKAALGPAARALSISSHKGAIGHLLAAAGALQTVLTVKSIKHGLVPPTVNLTEPDPLCDLDYTPASARQRQISNALCITAGFGGQCGLIVLGKA